VSDELAKIRTMKVDWGNLSDSEALLDRVRRALGL